MFEHLVIRIFQVTVYLIQSGLVAYTVFSVLVAFWSLD
jgi:hypothetical protein